MRPWLLVALVGCSPGGWDPNDHTRIDSSPQPSVEVCNGLDDDRDGAVDEGCLCAGGTTQACWPGYVADRGRGACRDGQQTCTATGEFDGAWGPCEGAVLPTQDVPNNGIDEDCDGTDATGCVAGKELCSGGIDEDCDTLVDCADPDCAAECSPCSPTAAIEDCATAADDDCDGMLNCRDLDCAAALSCTQDCTCVPGAVRWCDTVVECAWGRQECLPDGTWGTCVETTERPPGCTGPVYNLSCCVESGACCQKNKMDDMSLGHCEGILTCASP